MKTYITFCLILNVLLLNAQNYNCKEIHTLDSAYVASKTSYFQIEEGGMKGNGANVIKEVLKKSQFFIIGEIHGSSQISNFTNAILPIAKKTGYRNFALEVGPHSAEVLNKISSTPKQTISEMNKFNSKYYFEDAEDTSIPFFKGVEDAQFLATAAALKFDLWGIDQEYYYAVFHLFDELLDIAKSKSNFEEIKTIKIQADSDVKKWFVKEENSNDEIDVFGEILNEESVQRFFSQFNASDGRALEIIKDLKYSWDIYTNWRNGSHATRISYMRSNFTKQYDAVKENKEFPKVLMKIGGLHARRIIALDAYDMGHYLDEIAKAENQQSTSVIMSNRFLLRNEKEIDVAKSGHVRAKRLSDFYLQGKANEWTIINLKVMREAMNAGTLKLPNDDSYHEIRKLIEGYDYQVICPMDQYATDNFTK